MTDGRECGMDTAVCVWCGGLNCAVVEEFDEGEKIMKRYLDCLGCGNAVLLPDGLEVSAVSRVGVAVIIPPGYRLLNHRDELEPFDKWFNFSGLDWDVVDDAFHGYSCEHYIAIRTMTVIGEDELPQELRGR